MEVHRNAHPPGSRFPSVAERFEIAPTAIKPDTTQIAGEPLRPVPRPSADAVGLHQWKQLPALNAGYVVEEPEREHCRMKRNGTNAELGLGGLVVFARIVIVQVLGRIRDLDAP